MENLTSAIYFLKVTKDKVEVKVFKIVKNWRLWRSFLHFFLNTASP
jgi:hypothetical protein